MPVSRTENLICNLLAGELELFDLQPNFAALGELDGIVHQIRQDLAKPKRVTQQLFRNARRDMSQKLDAPCHAPFAR
jgi:hypothetical protein